MFKLSSLPTLHPGIKMRACRAYSNLPPMYASMWSEYKLLRGELSIMESMYDGMPPEKPHYKLEEGKPRIQSEASHKVQLYKRIWKARNRMQELAQYFWQGLGWIAPDFTEAELKRLEPKR